MASSVNKVIRISSLSKASHGRRLNSVVIEAGCARQTCASFHVDRRRPICADACRQSKALSVSKSPLPSSSASALHDRPGSRRRARGSPP
jgi:hypothetical protein